MSGHIDSSELNRRLWAVCLPNSIPGSLIALAVVLGLGSCVAQETHDQTMATAKHYEKRVFELDAQVADLERENLRLRGQLEASDIEVAEAGFTDSIDQRLADLRNIVSDLGFDPGDVTKFSVDGGYVYRMKDSILFALGSSQVSAEGRKVLAEVAKDIQSQAYGTVYVRGHTDNVPIAKPETKQAYPLGNLQLSTDRANQVAWILKNEGRVDSTRVVVMGFGPNDPVAPNDSATNRQKNRRVDIFVSNGDGPGPKAN